MLCQQFRRANRLARSNALQLKGRSSGPTIRTTKSAGSKLQILIGDTWLMSFLGAELVDFPTGQSAQNSPQLQSLFQNQTPTILRNNAPTEIQTQSVWWNLLQLPGWRFTLGQGLRWTRSRSKEGLQEPGTQMAARISPGSTKFGSLTPCPHQVLIFSIFQFCF